MLWLTITVISYFMLAVGFLIDKYILMGPIPGPKVYAFYSGILGLLVLLLIPFVGFYFPGTYQTVLALLTGVMFVLGLFRLYSALRSFEPSRVIPAIGALTALFTFSFVYLFSLGKESLDRMDALAFLLLVAGSFLITNEKGKNISFSAFKLSLFAAVPLALYMVLTKYVYLGQSFWNGLIWIRIGAALMALLFLFFAQELKEEIWKKKTAIPQKPLLLAFNQAWGAGANLLLNWAIALAPLVYLAIINALVGIQYVFLLVLTIIVSLRFPKFLKEKLSQEIIVQKALAVLLIGGGLALLFL